MVACGLAAAVPRSLLGGAIGSGKYRTVGAGNVKMNCVQQNKMNKIQNRRLTSVPEDVRVKHVLHVHRELRHSGMGFEALVSMAGALWLE